MSSHWEWEKETIIEHNENKPFAPENGEPLKFNIGDNVICTNDYGVEFSLKVTGYYKPEKIDSLYAVGYRYLLDWDCYWMPASEKSLRLDTK